MTKDVFKLLNDHYERKSVKTIEALLGVVGQKWDVDVTDGKFFQLTSAGINSNKFFDNGWKFHLSVAPVDAPKAWNIVFEELDRNPRGLVAKVMNLQTLENNAAPSANEAGKAITIYDDGADISNTMTLLARIEQRLLDAKILLGPSVRGDRPLPGSYFFHYRNDRTADSRYIAAKDAGNYNPAGKPDPFKDRNLGSIIAALPPVKLAPPTSESKFLAKTGAFANIVQKVASALKLKK